ncbi:hypothetical protein OXIME_000856 [Oxyplasma meridianum]|uniref:Uncharacterized protein n=1 Tax=Oxyplasma meridianum TaxID=3073602 RepID=A0AAX4NHQ8_9ARCH
MSILNSVIGTFLSIWVNNIRAYPLLLFRFLIPVILIFGATFSLQRRSRKTKLDSLPTIEQKREKFLVPKDFFNKELEFIKNDDYRHYLNPILKEMENMETIRRNLKILMKRYSKYENMSQSSYSRRKKKGLQLRNETFNQILETYGHVKKMKFSTVEIEQMEKERVL